MLVDSCLKSSLYRPKRMQPKYGTMVEIVNLIVSSGGISVTVGGRPELSGSNILYTADQSTGKFEVE